MPVSEELRIGTELLGYRVEELAGRGGMGAVYRATDLRLRRQVALKVIAPQLAKDEGFRRRFLAESEVATSLEHPHILPVYDAGEANRSLYIAMRYVEESDLKRLLREDGHDPRTHDAAARRGRRRARHGARAGVDPPRCEAVEHPDQRAGRRGRSYLADFGLTQRAGEGVTSAGAPQMVGTVDYIAPEQIERDDVDARADVYALGCVLFECLTGQVPFPRDSDLAVLWAHMRVDPARPSDLNPELPSAIDEVIERALAKDPDERYATSGELVRAARDALGLSEVRVVRQRTPLLLLGAGVLVTAVAAAAFAVSGGGDSATALRGNTLVRIDPATNRVSAVIDVGEKPIGLAVNGGTAWVYNLGDSSVSQVDISTQSVRRSIPISTVPVTAAYYAGPPSGELGGSVARRRSTRRHGGAHTHWRRRRQARVRPGRRACRRRGCENAVWVLDSGESRGCPYFWDPEHSPSASTGTPSSRVADEWARCGSGATSVVRLGLRHRSRSAVSLALGLRTLGARAHRRAHEPDHRNRGAWCGCRRDQVVVEPAPAGGSVWVHAATKAGASSGSIARRSASPEKSARSRAGPDLRATPQARSGGTIPSRESTVRPRHRKILSSIRVAPESTRRSRFHSSTITGADSVWATVTPAFLP